MKHYLSLAGRSGRLEFLTVWIGSSLASALLVKIMFYASLFAEANIKSFFRLTVMVVTVILVTVLIVGIHWLFFACLVRRIHDFGLSGWWLLIVLGVSVGLLSVNMFLPWVVVLFFGTLVLIFLSGNINKNAFGNPPELFGGCIEVKKNTVPTQEKRIDFKL